jgi:hypothetical protein
VAKAILGEGNWLPLRFGVPGPHTNTLTFTGIPGSQYAVQFSTNLATGNWFPLTTNTAPADGYATVLDTSATNGQRFYRVSAPSIQ